MNDLVLLPLYVEEDAWAVAPLYAFRPRRDSYIRAAQITIQR